MGRQGNRKKGAQWESGASWIQPVPAILLLGALTVLVYLNSLRNEFVFDDLGLVVNNRAIRSPADLPRLIGLSGHAAYRPLRTISYAVDYLLFGLNPAGFRAVNIALHVLNGALVFLLFRRLLRNPRPALLAAILFAIHPIQTDSVAYISGRRDVLFTLFYLVGFTWYVRYRETDRLRYLLLTGFAYLLSLLSKEMAISLPLLCLCYDVVRSIPVAEGKRALRPLQALAEGVRTALGRHTMLYAVGTAALLSLVWYYAYRANPSYHQAMYGGGLGPTLMTSARIFVHYLNLLVFPVTLNADYSYNAFPVSQSLADARVIFALIVLAASWWGIYRLLTYDRWAAFGGLWFFVTLLPVSQIIPHHEMLAEHYLYLPSAGFFLTVGTLLERSLAHQRRRAAVVAAFAFVVVLLGVRTAVRNRDWRDSQTLWTKTVQTAPGSARAHNNLGEIALSQGRLQEAYREFQEAIRIKPDDAVHLDNLGVVLLRYGQFDEAEKYFRNSLRILPRPKSHVNLGLVHLNRRQLEEAEREFRTALTSQRLTQSFRASILNNLGIVLELKGNRREAEQAFTEAVRLAPNLPDARANMGKAYLDRGRSQEALSELAEAVRLKGSDPRFHYMLGEAYYRQGMKELALVEVSRALSLKTDFPEARGLLNKLIREKGRGRKG